MILVVINKDSLTRGGLCGKLHGGRSQLLFALHQSSIDSQLFVENRDFCLPHLYSTPSLGDSRRNIAITFNMEKLELCGYPNPMVKQELSYRKQIARKLRTQYVEGIYMITP